MGTPKPVIVWFRNDLRLADNPALAAAIDTRAAIIPVFIWAPQEEAPWEPGGASKWWLRESLSSLSAALGKRGSRLILRKGSTAPELRNLIEQTGAGAVFWNNRYEPAVRDRDGKLQQALRESGVEVRTFNAALLREPWEVQKKAGGPFQVFTAYWNHCLKQPDPPQPLPAPTLLFAPSRWPASLEIDDLDLKPIPDWAGGLRKTWLPGEHGAASRLRDFIRSACEDYGSGRDKPGIEGTSRLSPHLHFGEISPRQVWHSLRSALASDSIQTWRKSRFIAELGWREFAHHLLWHFPQTDLKPLKPAFEKLRWHTNREMLQAWQRGKTGYPIVDAGMRQLWQTGWMHNRVRMIAGSFLVKDLLISWTEGAKWFWDTLVDADLAQNTLGWQWVAGCGADAAPFFRVFNPTLQGEKYDSDGSYVRRWLLEIASLPNKWLHKPHLAPAEVLAKAGINLGVTYPEPIVSHAIARDVALEAFLRIRTAKT